MVAKKVKKRSQRDALVSALEIQKQLRCSGSSIGAVIAVDPPSIEQVQQSAIGFAAIGLGSVSIPDPKATGPDTQLEFSFVLRNKTNSINQMANGSIKLQAPTSKSIDFLRFAFHCFSQGLQPDFLLTRWPAPINYQELKSSNLQTTANQFTQDQSFTSQTQNIISNDMASVQKFLDQSDPDKLYGFSISQDGNHACVTITAINNSSNPINECNNEDSNILPDVNNVANIH